jgi:hypothetical protein
MSLCRYCTAGLQELRSSIGGPRSWKVTSKVIVAAVARITAFVESVSVVVGAAIQAVTPIVRLSCVLAAVRSGVAVLVVTSTSVVSCNEYCLMLRYHCFDILFALLDFHVYKILVQKKRF